MAGAARQVQPAEGRRRREARRRARQGRRPHRQLQDLGVDVTSTKANLDERQKALDEYKARARQLELIKARFEKLKGKLDALTKLGLAVNVRHNRMVISLPGDVLFDSGRETLKKDGKDILARSRPSSRRTPSSSRATTRSPATPTTSRSRTVRSRTTGACR